MDTLDVLAVGDYAVLHGRHLVRVTNEVLGSAPHRYWVEYVSESGGSGGSSGTWNLLEFSPIRVPELMLRARLHACRWRLRDAEKAVKDEREQSAILEAALGVLRDVALGAKQ